MSGYTKYVAQKRDKVLKRGAKVNLSECNTSADKKHLEEQLKAAKEKLDKIVAAGDARGAAKLQEIIDNLSQTLAR